MPKRGIEFPPPYGHELPLPSDTGDSYEKVVTQLLVLWMLIRREPNLGREIQAKVVGAFFDSLSEEKRRWLEGDDPYWKKRPRPRAVLVKERAIQLCQQGKDLRILKDEELQDTVKTFKRWIEEARK